MNPNQLKQNVAQKMAPSLKGIGQAVGNAVAPVARSVNTGINKGVSALGNAASGIKNDIAQRMAAPAIEGGAFGPLSHAPVPQAIVPALQGIRQAGEISKAYAQGNTFSPSVPAHDDYIAGTKVYPSADPSSTYFHDDDKGMLDYFPEAYNNQNNQNFDYNKSGMYKTQSGITYMVLPMGGEESDGKVHVNIMRQDNKDNPAGSTTDPAEIKRINDEVNDHFNRLVKPRYSNVKGFTPAHGIGRYFSPGPIGEKQGFDFHTGNQ